MHSHSSPQGYSASAPSHHPAFQPRPFTDVTAEPHDEMFQPRPFHDSLTQETQPSIHSPSLHQQTGLNQPTIAVQSAPTVQLKEKQTGSKAETATYYVDDEGIIYASPQGPRIGVKGDQESYLTVSPKGQLGIPWTEAVTGSLNFNNPGGGNFVLGGSILRVKRVSIHLVTDSTTTSDVPDGLQPIHVKPLGGPIGILFDEGTGSFGSEILKHTGKWEPIEFSRLSAGLKDRLKPDSRLDLNDGSFWILMSFHLKDETRDTLRWVPPGHSQQEYQKREQEMTEQAEKLPENLKDQVEEYLRTIALVSTVEGSFNAKSPASDTYASLGIFQWAMPKNKTGESASLGQFFGKLKQRATLAQATESAHRSEEEKLYIDAWARCTAHGLDINAKGQILLNGKLATGADVEKTMQGSMSKDEALRNYQLVAALDWIEAFKEVVVRPGPVGASLIGNGYKETSNGTSVTFTRKTGTTQYTISLSAPNSYQTVGSIFTSEKAIATAVMLGVNRPHYVETALWRSLNPQADPKAQTDILLNQLIQVVEAVESPSADTPAPKKSTSKKRTNKNIDASTIAGLGENAIASYAALQSLIWPPVGEIDEAALVTAFTQQAMQLYKPSDARTYHRERRFTTVESADWSN